MNSISIKTGIQNRLDRLEITTKMKNVFVVAIMHTDGGIESDITVTSTNKGGGFDEKIMTKDEYEKFKNKRTNAEHIFINMIFV